MKAKIIIAAGGLALLALCACNKSKADPHIPPAVTLKSSAVYTSAETVTAKKQDTLLVGVIVEKTEDDLKSYNVSFRYDAETTSTTFYNYLMDATEKTYYEKDIKIITRNQSGKEVWLFSIVDRDGNLTQKTITITVP